MLRVMATSFVWFNPDFFQILNFEYLGDQQMDRAKVPD
ncbi:hypothetical protein Z949_2672 [Sulfitobacter guttiformis KCTC 32187]|nr:hypothetical protein Z949_2672 [Sulfitobacter guttiformis KCTC 32187]